jgi:hypothetical protein
MRNNLLCAWRHFANPGGDRKFFRNARLRQTLLQMANFLGSLAPPTQLSTSFTATHRLISLSAKKWIQEEIF